MKRVLVLLLFSCSLLAQKAPFELSTVEKLKGVESSHFDPALPTLFFAKWFKRLVRPAVPDYQSRECGGAAQPPTGKRECVYVTAAMPDRTVTLKFAYDPAHKTFDYLEGSIGPNDPKSKQPAKAIKKLSELNTLINPEGQGI